MVFRLLLDVVEDVAEITAVVKEEFGERLPILNLLELPTIFESIKLVHELCPLGTQTSDR